MEKPTDQAMESMLSTLDAIICNVEDGTMTAPGLKLSGGGTASRDRQLLHDAYVVLDKIATVTMRHGSCGDADGNGNCSAHGLPVPDALTAYADMVASR